MDLLILYLKPIIDFLGTLTAGLFLLIILSAAILLMLYGVFFGIKFLWIHRKKIAKFDWDF